MVTNNFPMVEKKKVAFPMLNATSFDMWWTQWSTWTNILKICVVWNLFADERNLRWKALVIIARDTSSLYWITCYVVDPLQYMDKLLASLCFLKLFHRWKEFAMEDICDYCKRHYLFILNHLLCGGPVTIYGQTFCKFVSFETFSPMKGTWNEWNT